MNNQHQKKVVYIDSYQTHHIYRYWFLYDSHRKLLFLNSSCRLLNIDLHRPNHNPWNNNVNIFVPVQKSKSDAGAM